MATAGMMVGTADRRHEGTARRRCDDRRHRSTRVIPKLKAEADVGGRRLGAFRGSYGKDQDSDTSAVKAVEAGSASRYSPLPTCARSSRPASISKPLTAPRM